MVFVESRWLILFAHRMIFFFPCRHLSYVYFAQTRGCFAGLLGTAQGAPCPEGTRFSTVSLQVRHELKGSSQPSRGACRHVTVGARPLRGSLALDRI